MTLEDESARIREEISILKLQMSQLEAYGRTPQVRNNTTQTDVDDELGSPTDTKHLQFDSQMDVRNQHIDIRKDVAQCMTST
ncbi:MAG: hypothetical protein N0C90_23325, partial [Candidatus Thiodiazotropha endolucinida]|nr:hypothetical protein [Candidatus Thiodiazotropha taylori]MCW4264287.1 hypothetical protein [Candidatus Thiodiazotropha endolucinida]